MADSVPSQLPTVVASTVVSEEQPYLFDEKCLPLRPELVALVKDKDFTHTGKIVGRDAELCRAVCRDLIAGLSGRKVAVKYKISRNTVLAIENVMRERGELEPLRKRVLIQLEDCIYLGLERIQEALATDQINAGQLPIPVMAMIDKKAQLEAGIVPGTQRTEKEITAESLRLELERIRQMKQVGAPVIDVGSDGKAANGA